MLMMERLLSMWGLAVALLTIAFIAAVVSRQLWLIVSNGGLLLAAFAQRGIGGWLGDLVLDQASHGLDWTLASAANDQANIIAVTR